MKRLLSFLRDDSGLELPEYAVMTALIVAAIIGAITLLATAIGNRFDHIEGVISDIDAS